MGKEIAGDPQHLDSSLALQLESKVCYFIQILVGLLQGGALRSNIPAGNRGRTLFGRVEYTKTSHTLVTFKYYYMYLFLTCTGKVDKGGFQNQGFRDFIPAQHNY